MAIVCYPIATGIKGRRWKCKDTISGNEWVAEPEFKFDGRLAVDAYHETDTIPKPTEGVILHGGWGGKKDPNLWQVVNMRDKPLLFKVVDEHGVNIATDFSTRLNAQKYIDYERFVKSGQTPPSPPSPPPPTPPTPPSPPSGSGKFKAANDVLQINANNARIPIWVLGHGNWTDRAGSGSASGTGNNTVVTLSGQVRYGVKCKKGAGDGIEDLGKALAQGYQDSPADYKSIEQTGFVEITKLAGSDSDQDITFFGPSGRHTGGGPKNKGCMGSCYKTSVHAKTGKNRFAYETWHVNYAYVPWKDALNEVVKQTTQGKRIGIKYVKMVVGSGKDAYARVELWLSTKAIGYNEPPHNEWQLVRVQEDHNNWPKANGLDDCGCDKSNQAMVWGAPGVVYRWDNQTGKLTLATIQEIKVPTTFHKEGDIVKT